MRLSSTAFLISWIVTSLFGAMAYAGIATASNDGFAANYSAGASNLLLTPKNSAQELAVDQILPVHGIDLPGFPAPSPMPAIRTTPRDSAAQDLPVEPIPAPTAVASGLAVLGGLAAFRIFRRLRFV